MSALADRNGKNRTASSYLAVQSGLSKTWSEIRMFSHGGSNVFRKNVFCLANILMSWLLFKLIEPEQLQVGNKNLYYILLKLTLVLNSMVWSTERADMTSPVYCKCKAVNSFMVD